MLITLEPGYGTVHHQIWNKRRGDYIIIRHAHIIITNFVKKNNEEFLDSLSVYDKIYFEQKIKGGYFIEELNEFRVPRGYPLERIKEFFPRYKIIYDNNHFKFDKIDEKLYCPPRDDIQKMCLAHALSMKPYEYLNKFTCQIIDMDTGDGKTYVASAVTVQLKGKSVIFLPIEKLFSQWVASFAEFTSVTEKDIIVIKGYKMMKKLHDGEFRDKKVFLISIDTFASFVKRRGNIDAVTALQQTYARNLFVDEAHREIDSLMKVISLSNFKMSYFLTSSFGRADKFENRIYKECFKGVPRIGKSLKHQSEKHIRINTAFYRYTLLSDEHRFAWRPRIGLNSKSYESVIFKGEGKKQLIPAFHTTYLYCKAKQEPNGKFLILSSTIHGAESLAKIMRIIEPTATVGVYHSKIKKKDKEICFENDIIVSTIDSLSTGAHIEGLQFCINIGTYSNAIWADQIAGRLRNNGYTNLIYFELVNKGYKQTYNQYQARLPALCKKSLDGKVGEL